MNIIKHKYLFIITGLAIVFVSLAITLIFGLRPGIDFTGGALTEVRFETLPEKTDVEGAVSAVISEQFSVRQSTSDEGNGYLISTRDLSSEESQALSEAVLGLGEGAEIVRYTSVGPVIGAELADKAVWAIGAVLILIIVYVAFAFAGIGKPVSSWIYGFMTIVVLGHDILVPIAAMSLLGYFIGAEVDILFVTALLTILGFSVNDTIVIFDRVREKLMENRTEQKHTVKVVGGMDRIETTYTLNRSFGTLVEEAINETMARSINTSLTVLFALGALYLFGGEVTETFVLVLIVGVIAGAYSSIFIASPLLVVYQEWQAKRAELQTAKK